MAASDAPASVAPARPAVSECDRLRTGLAIALDGLPTTELRSPATSHRLAELLDRVEHSGDAVSDLLDSLTDPRLIGGTRRLLLAAAHLTHEVAVLYWATGHEPAGVARARRAVDLALRQFALEQRGARAQCEDDGSRPQSEAWRAATIAAVAATASSLPSCRLGPATGPADAEPVVIRMHIDASGHVSLAGPVDFSFTSALDTDQVHCLVTRLESVDFSAPSGTAVVDVPVCCVDAHTG